MSASQVIDQRTPALGLALPHPQNELRSDILRLREVLGQIEDLLVSKADMTTVEGMFLDLIGNAPASLNTLRELSAALADDANLAGNLYARINLVRAELLALIAQRNAESLARDAAAAGEFRRFKNRAVFDLKF